MIRGPDARSDKFLTDLANITRRLERAQNQITSGRRINRVSDSPDEVSRLLQIRTELASTVQIRFNLGRVQAEVDAAEQALNHSVGLLDRVVTLGTQGGTDLVSATERQALSFEVGTILEQLVTAAATVVEGRYIFSGDNDLTAPYALDLDLFDPFSAYQGSASTRQSQHPSGWRFSLAATAEDIFDNAGPGASVFRSVNNLRHALAANDTQATLEALAEVRGAMVHLNNKHAFYGTVQNQVREAVNYSHQQELRLNEQLSQLQDADLTAAILELNQAQFNQNAALRAEGLRANLSLFDYLR
ncbi:MAG: hypothetical protein FJW20_12040 [Acidimicrobiia bacterium]|nr:hypothetical protein [Acidimicrobiia bacterium]